MPRAQPHAGRTNDRMRTANDGTAGTARVSFCSRQRDTSAWSSGTAYEEGEHCRMLVIIVAKAKDMPKVSGTGSSVVLRPGV